MAYLDDPRVYFAAERSVLAWQRSSIALMGLGFVIERFSLFANLIAQENVVPEAQATLSLYLGVGFILLGALTALLAAVQFIIFCHTLSPQEMPRGHLYWYPAVLTVFIGVSATALSIWLLLAR